VSFSPGMSTPPRQGSGMISVAAFRRPAPRTGSEPPVGSRDVSPLSIKKKELRGSPNTPRTSVSSTFSPMSPPPGAQPPVLASPLPQEHPEDEFDYISAYYSAGGDEVSSPPSYTESRVRSGSLR
jgi:hypothetical protein